MPFTVEAIDDSGRHRWLLNSGIQRPAGPDAGAVHAWIDHSTGQGAYLYSEATGYFVTLACHLAHATGHADWLIYARRAGDWIVGLAMLADGGVLTRKHASPLASQPDAFGFQRQLVVFFDCAMAGYGLLTLHKATANRGYLESADAIGRFCLTHFFTQHGGEAGPIFDALNQVHRPQEDRWSLHWGSFNLKAVMFLVDLAELTGERRYSLAADSLLAPALRAQRDDGRFVTNRAGTNTHLHPHCYTIEGLLYLAWKRSRSDLLERARAAIDFAFRHCLHPGRVRVHAWPDPDPCAVRLRSDVIAQVLRCYYIAKCLDAGYHWPWEDEVPALRQFADAFTLPDGGTSFGFVDDLRLLPHANAWCHLFNIEMRLHERYAKDWRGGSCTHLVIT